MGRGRVGNNLDDSAKKIISFYLRSIAAAARVGDAVSVEAAGEQGRGGAPLTAVFCLVKGSRKCELNCQATGYRFYVRQAEKVIDGTPCDQNGTAICVSGQCKHVTTCSHERQLTVYFTESVFQAGRRAEGPCWASQSRRNQKLAARGACDLRAASAPPHPTPRGPGGLSTLVTCSETVSTEENGSPSPVFAIQRRCTRSDLGARGGVAVGLPWWEASGEGIRGPSVLDAACVTPITSWPPPAGRSSRPGSVGRQDSLVPAVGECSLAWKNLMETLVSPAIPPRFLPARRIDHSHLVTAAAISRAGEGEAQSGRPAREHIGGCARCELSPARPRYWAGVFQLCQCERLTALGPGLGNAKVIISHPLTTLRVARTQARRQELVPAHDVAAVWLVRARFVPHLPLAFLLILVLGGKSLPQAGLWFRRFPSVAQAVHQVTSGVTQSTVLTRGGNGKIEEVQVGKPRQAGAFRSRCAVPYEQQNCGFYSEGLSVVRACRSIV
ncbi:hypothetical protein CB1_000590013 [Camelus ferus]|nr:hypothetical protein CB1_000590013 [Camelus ferus]